MFYFSAYFDYVTEDRDYFLDYKTCLHNYGAPEATEEFKNLATMYNQHSNRDEIESWLSFFE